MITLVRRLAALLAVAAVGFAVPLAASAQDANKAAPAQAAPATPPAAQPAVPAAAPSAAPGVQPSVSKETIENPYGLEALWRQGDFVAKGTLVILVIMSMGSWYIMFVKVYEQMKLFAPGQATCRPSSGSAELGAGRRRKRSRKAARSASSPRSGIKATAEARRPARARRPEHLGHDVDPARDRQRVTAACRTASRSSPPSARPRPFVGLFGTVWGIYHALTAIGIAGQASIDKVAGPVGEALIMTAIGLAVAVPAVLGYNWLVRRNKVAMEHAARLRRRPARRAAERQRQGRAAPVDAALGIRHGNDRRPGRRGGEDEVISAINTTPLVDVMLVLLIIFLITIPVVTQPIPVKLPKERNEVRETKPENIVISVEQGRRRLLERLEYLRDTEALFERLKKIAVLAAAARGADPRRQAARYESVGRVVYACQRAGILKIGFITEPPPRGDVGTTRKHDMAMNVGSGGGRAIRK